MSPTRYKQVVAVIGFNPNKTYPVTPEQRAELLREMLKGTSNTNVRVEGAWILKIVMCVSSATTSDKLRNVCDYIAHATSDD